MADHLDEPGLMPPAGDPSIDITDVYAFKKGSTNKSILMLNVNPLATSPSFNHRALYQLAVDTNGDARADIAFNFRFSRPHSGQKVKVRRATGGDAREDEVEGQVIISGPTDTVLTSGPYKLFAGRRSDPFFFDLLGFLAGFAFTGSDFFVDKNVFGIALEVPNRALGRNPNIGVWGRTLLPEEEDDDGDDDDDDDDDDDLTQVERMGRPAINTVFMKGARKREFNRAKPQNDPAEFTGDVVSVLKSFGHSDAEAAGLAAILLPDILTYNYDSGAGFLNGRGLTDDVIDIELGIVSKGAVTTDGVGPHADLLSVFPFMGPPH